MLTKTLALTHVYHRALVCFVIIMAASFCFCKMRHQNCEDSSVDNDYALPDALKREVSCTDLIKALSGWKNLLRFSEHRSTVRTGSDKYSHYIDTKFVVSGHAVSYSIHLNTKISKPFFLDFRPEHYLYSKITVDDKVFLLDLINVEPSGFRENVKMNVPLTLCNILQCGSFRFLNQEYIAIHGYPPCNGRACVENFIILINTSTKDLKILFFNEYFPFSYDHIFLGDSNGDQCLDYFLVEELKQQLIYNVHRYSMKHMTEPLSESGCFLRYSCEKCSGLPTDTLIILDDKCGLLK